MPTFNTTQKKSIDQALRDSARVLFVEQGMQKTTLDQLAQRAGIVKSTFYAFYESKERLYLDLLEEEAEMIEQRVWGTVKIASTTKEGLLLYMRAMLAELQARPLTQRLMTDSIDRQLLERRVTPAYIGRKVKRSIEPLVHYIRIEQRAGRITYKGPPEIATETIISALVASLHQQKGYSLSQPAQTLLFESVAEKLTKQEEHNGI